MALGVHAGIAVDRFVSLRLERNAGLRSAIGANGFRGSAWIATVAFEAGNQPAIVAALGQIRQAFSGEELLLRSTESKLFITSGACQTSIFVHLFAPGGKGTKRLFWATQGPRRLGSRGNIVESY
jgi:hypothetical protein